MNSTTIQLDAIDAEHDIRPVVVVVPDYDGSPIVHVFVTGERVLRMAPNEDWTYEFPYPDTMAERQAVAALHYHLGSMTEEQDQRLAEVWGTPTELPTFDDVMSEPTDEGHALVAWAGTVAAAVWAEEASLDTWYSIDTEPSGW